MLTSLTTDGAGRPLWQTHGTGALVVLGNFSRRRSLRAASSAAGPGPPPPPPCRGPRGPPIL